MKFLFAILFLLVCARGSVAQDLGHEVPHDTLEKYSIYDLDLPPPSFHADRRAKLLEQMQSGAVALFMSAPEQTRANDIQYLYHQNADLYYLTGCLEPSSALLMSKDAISLPDGGATHEILFVSKRDPARETWTGHRLGPQGALSVLRVKSSMPIDSLGTMLRRLLPSANRLTYVPQSEPISNAILDSTFAEAALTKNLIAERYPNLTPDPALIQALHAMRAVKTPVEIALMRKAISISNNAHNAVLSQAKPGWHEYEIQALAENIFTKSGAEYTAYPCIVGSGPNSTILHYESNRRQTKAGDFIEMDVGAEYHGYAADVTRSFPISGKFSPEQRTIYSLVLEAQDSGIRECRAGMPFRSAHNAAVRVIRRGLLQLGIIKDSAEYSKYFMHGTSHYLGLDVHDVGKYGPLEAGNILTVEPGIYIAQGSPCDPKWWNIGCRIEDDILVMGSVPKIMSAGSPRQISEIERMMATGH